MHAQFKVQIPAKAAVLYPILIEDNLLNTWHDWLTNVYSGYKIVLITDTNVLKLYADEFTKKLIAQGYQVLVLSVDAGERSKTLKTKCKLELEMLKHKFDRHTLCIAFGGGVIGDLTGFISATYLRGIKFIQIPTTLLAMIDSSVGGKTAVNTPYGKNLIGAFWQPQAVIMDTQLLKSLPKKQIINGLIEALKIFLTSDAQSFRYLLDNLGKVLNLDEVVLPSIIERAVRLKALIVEADEREENLRMILNFGHTIGHAIEKLSNYKLLHGYAVALGILVESKIAQIDGYLSEVSYQQIVKVLAQLGITQRLLQKYDINEIVEVAFGDKKNKSNQIYCILLNDIGSVHTVSEKVATVVKPEVIIHALRILKN